MKKEQNETNKYKVYMIINEVTGKFYIGKTVNTLTRRFNDHFSEAFKTKPEERTYWQNTLVKYEKDNFDILQIGYPKDSETMNKMEIEFIKNLRAQDRSIGYNTAFGGEGGAMPKDVLNIVADKLRSRKKEGGTSKFFGVSSVNLNRKIFKDTDLVWGFWICTEGRSNGKGFYRTELEAAYFYNDYVFKHSLPHKINTFTEQEQIEIDKILSKKKYGYYWATQSSRFIVRFLHDKKRINLGSYKNEIDAKMAYNKFVLDNNLDKKLNPV